MYAKLGRLRQASREGDTNKLEQFLEEDPSLLDGFDHDVPATEATDNPLHIAASFGHADFTCKLLTLKPELAEKPNREGRFPLHLAAANGHLQVVEKLADHLDKVNQRIYLSSERIYGYTPAHIAAINGRHNVVQFLIERCKDVLNKTTYRNQTLLHLAVIANCTDSVQYFINQGVSINEKDSDGNTCLHLACKKKNQQVIASLLEKEGIEVNSTNARGLTPLDLLLVSSWDSAIEVSLVNMLRKLGGEEAIERGNPRSNRSNSKRTTFSYRNKCKAKTRNDSKTLLLVATLVATMTFTAISNPPGGFIQPPSDNGNANGPGQADSNMLPAGKPVLVSQLRLFYLLDSVALFSSISVILFLLCGTPKTMIAIKFLAGILWLSAFCTAFAFASAFFVICFPDSSPTVMEANTRTLYGYYDEDQLGWLYIIFIAWSIVYIGAGLWGSVRVILFVWKKGGFTRNLPNWVHKAGWPRNGRFRKATGILLVVCFWGILGLSAWSLWDQFQSSVLLF